jgi:hypothetical protein
LIGVNVSEEPIASIFVAGKGKISSEAMVPIYKTALPVTEELNPNATVAFLRFSFFSKYRWRVRKNVIKLLWAFIIEVPK